MGMKFTRVIPFYLLATALTLSACATLEGRTSGFKISTDGYATQKNAPIPPAETEYSPVIPFPKIIGDGAPLGNIEALSQNIFEILPSAYESSYNIKENIMNVSLGLTTAEFAQANIPPQYRIASNIRYTLLPDVLSENPVHPDLAKYMRTFEVTPRFTDNVLTSLTQGRIRLEDGCLYMGKRGRKTTVMFRREAGLRLDEQGYVEIYNRIFPNKMGVRPGNKFGWGDGIRNVSDTDAGKRIIVACGAETAVSIGMPFYQTY